MTWTVEEKTYSNIFSLAEIKNTFISLLDGQLNKLIINQPEYEKVIYFLNSFYLENKMCLFLLPNNIANITNDVFTNSTISGFLLDLSILFSIELEAIGCKRKLIEIFANSNLIRYHDSFLMPEQIANSLESAYNKDEFFETFNEEFWLFCLLMVFLCLPESRHFSLNT